MKYKLRQITTIAVTLKNKEKINNYIRKLEVKTQDDVLNCLLKMAKDFLPELKEEAEKLNKAERR